MISIKGTSCETETDFSQRQSGDGFRKTSVNFTDMNRTSRVLFFSDCGSVALIMTQDTFVDELKHKDLLFIDMSLKALLSVM